MYVYIQILHVRHFLLVPLVPVHFGIQWDGPHGWGGTPICTYTQVFVFLSWASTTLNVCLERVKSRQTIQPREIMLFLWQQLDGSGEEKSTKAAN